MSILSGCKINDEDRAVAWLHRHGSNADPRIVEAIRERFPRSARISKALAPTRH